MPPPIAAMPFSTVADLTETTTEPGEPFPCSPIEGTAWYRIDAAEASTLRISVAGDHFVHFNVYRQTSAGMAGLSAVAWCVSHGGQSVVPVAEGETLYVQLARMPWSLGQAVQLDVDVVPPPPNDAFAAATPVPALPFTQTVEVSAATAEPAEPDLCTWSPSERTIWYTYTPTTNQSLMATGPGVAAYVGSSLDTLTSVGCRFFSPLTFAAQAGTTYYFQVGLSGGDLGHAQFTLDVAPPPTAAFNQSLGDPSTFDTVSFFNWSSDPAGTALTMAWDFGDGSVSTEHSPGHRYAADGDYTTTLTVTTPDGRSASTSQDVHVRTHDIQVARLAVPNKATAGQTARITIGVNNGRYPEKVEVSLYKSLPNGEFVLVGSGLQSVPARDSNRTTDYRIDYTFTADDAAATKVTFKAVATIVAYRDRAARRQHGAQLPRNGATVGRPYCVREAGLDRFPHAITRIELPALVVHGMGSMIPTEC